MSLLCPCRFSRQEYLSGLPCPPPADLPNPGIEPRAPALQVDSLLSEPPGKSKKLEWVPYPFSRGTSWPRNWTGVSCIVGRFLTSWATWEAHKTSYLMVKMWKPSLWNQEWNKEACFNHFYTTLFQIFIIRYKISNKNKSIRVGKEEIQLSYSQITWLFIWNN